MRAGLGGPLGGPLGACNRKGTGFPPPLPMVKPLGMGLLASGEGKLFSIELTLGMELPFVMGLPRELGRASFRESFPGLLGRIDSRGELIGLYIDESVLV